MKKNVIISAVSIVLFTVLAVSITIMCIGANKIIGKMPTNSEKGIDLYGTFDGNDLEIAESVEKRGEYEIKIPRIEGLKDKSVQKKVNGDMYTRIQKLLNKINSEEIHAYYYTYGNFENTISIEFYVTDENAVTQRLGLNYELVKGERIALEELFFEKSDLLGIVRKAFYNEFVLNGDYDYESESFSFDESEFYTTVQNYMNLEEKPFAFTPFEIYLLAGEETATVSMTEYADEITVYSKYNTKESLFEKDDIGFKGAFTCSNINYDMFDKIEYGYAAENLWYDITVWSNFYDAECPADKLEAFNAFKGKIYDEIDEFKKKYEKLAEKTPDRFYIVLEKPSLSIDMESVGEKTVYFDTASLNDRIDVYEMDKEYFETIYKDKLIEAYRYKYFVMAGGAYLPRDEDENVMTETETTEKTYNYIRQIAVG